MIGLIGGTGVYDASAMQNARKQKITTPYGATSDVITVGEMFGKEVAFLPRHGSNHTIPPHKINFKANIYAMKELGVERIIGVCAVGSLKEKFKPGELAIVDQFIDFSKTPHTFYDEGRFFHVSLADPFCSNLNSTLLQEAKGLGIPMHEHSTYLKIDGPQFSTRAASHMYRQFADLIGMTGVPEAILAREKEICYSIIAAVTDFDCWHEEKVTSEMVVNSMKKNSANIKLLLEKAIPKIGKERNCECSHALSGAEI
ncbi:MAG: S-methyl-5'-thioadenosine phosphorylase [archaeon]|nr:S-methyl-5'-thioadenosine phosphorylase [archaeon]